MGKRKQESSEIYFPADQSIKRARSWLHKSDAEFRYMLKGAMPYPAYLRLLMAIIPLLLGAGLILFAKMSALGAAFAIVGFLFLVLYWINFRIEQTSNNNRGDKHG
jgi:hypothetical protein